MTFNMKMVYIRNYECCWLNMKKIVSLTKSLNASNTKWRECELFAGRALSPIGSLPMQSSKKKKERVAIVGIN